MAGMLSMERLILDFHKLEGDFFHRLVHDLGQDPTNMRWVIAFWLWLESAGHHDFVRRAYALPGPVVLRLVEEAVACLRCLAGEGQAADAAAGGDNRVTRLPCSNAFLAKPIDDVGYFVDRRDKVLKGVNYMYKNVCLVVCVGNTGGARAAPPQISSPAGVGPLMMSSTDRAAPLMMSSTDRTLMTSFPDHAATLMTSSHGRAAQLMTSAPDHAATLMMNSPSQAAPVPLMMSWPGHAALPMPSSTLNPMASPWVPMPMQSALPEDYRSLFVTFSKGYPVGRDDILEFFNSMFGPCVDAVMLEKVQPGQVPVYGRVVLCSAEMIPVVLGGQQTAKFVIKGRHLWARVYVPSSRVPVHA